MKSKVCMVIVMAVLVMGFGLLLKGENTQASGKVPEIKEQRIVISQQKAEKEVRGQITVINDTSWDANILVLNGTLGPYASGYIKSGNSQVYPCGYATGLDVFALFETDAHLFIEWGLTCCDFKVYYHRVKRGVAPGSTVKISEM